MNAAHYQEELEAQENSKTLAEWLMCYLSVFSSLIQFLVLSLFIYGLMSFQTVWSASLSQARQAYDQGQYVKAERMLLPLAKRGVSEAQTKLGFIYLQGKGRPADPVRGMKWLDKAANQGNADALFALGVVHLRGEGVPQDEVEACKWFDLAARHGSDMGARYLAGSHNKMLPEEINLARRATAAWLSDHPAVQRALARKAGKPGAVNQVADRRECQGRSAGAVARCAG